MLIKINKPLNLQKGAATLVTAVILLISITLVLILTSKTVLMETKMTADNFRTSQAVAAANYGMDYGYAYFNNGGFDQDENGTLEATIGLSGATETPVYEGASFPPADLVSADGALTTSAIITFNNDPDSAVTLHEEAALRCIEAGTTPSFKHGTILAQGFSDDALATRTISQCVGPTSFIQEGKPDQPLVSQGNVKVTGNTNIVNRYSNTTIWSGDEVEIGNTASMATYIGTADPSTLTEAELTSLTIASNTQLASNSNLGNGLDIIDNDTNLSNLVGQDFFDNFFTVSRARLKAKAADLGQVYTGANISSADGNTGIIWIEGDAHLTGGTFGTLTDAAFLIINGNLTSTGNSTITGILYVFGTYSIGGTVNVIGSNVVEGTVTGGNLASLDPGVQVTTDIVSGTGTLNLIFWPGFQGSNAGHPSPGETAVIAGSWRDW